MSTMSELIKNFPTINDGISSSYLDGVFFLQETKYIPRKPNVYNPGICIVVQGHKMGYLGNQKFRYDPNHYLVTSVTIPFECETFGTPKEPLRALYINIDIGQLRELIGQINLHIDIGNKSYGTLPRGIGPAIMNKDMLEATTRLVKCLQSKIESQILGPSLIQEILYRVLCGTQAPILYLLATHSSKFSQMARIFKIMQNNYNKNLNIEQLANNAHLSVSAFHRAFKEITSDSPMQYLKKIRLKKARDFMVQENMKAYIAADKVGYESPSQFSREFKRYFGQSPAEMMRKLGIK